MKAFLVAVLSIAFAVAVAVVDRESGLPMWWHLRGELSASQVRIQALAAQNARLQAEVEALGNDPFALERAVREDLEWARAGEVVVRFGERARE